MERTEGVEDCPHCGGTGWTRVADGGIGAARPCDCRSRTRIDHLERAAGLPPRYENCTLENFETNLPYDKGHDLLRARRECQDYLDRYLSESGLDERGILFIGRPGTGKTHLAVAVLRQLIRRFGLRGKFVDFTTLIARIQATFDPTSEESKHQVLDPVLQADVLVLDELGAQKPTQFVQDTLYLIINTRYCQRRTTIFTTNFRLKAPFQPENTGARSIQEREFVVEATESRATRHDLLTERLTPMLVSRIREMARPLVIETEDFRAQDLRKLARR